LEDLIIYPEYSISYKRGKIRIVLFGSEIVVQVPDYVQKTLEDIFKNKRRVSDEFLAKLLVLLAGIYTSTEERK